MCGENFVSWASCHNFNALGVGISTRRIKFWVLPAMYRDLKNPWLPQVQCDITIGKHHFVIFFMAEIKGKRFQI